MPAWFLEIAFVQNVECVCVWVCMRVRVCPPPRALITIHMKGTYNNWLNQFYSFPFLYMTLAIDKLDGGGLNNTACHEKWQRR